PHEGIGTVHGSVRREHLQADTGSLRERPITERVAAVVELLWCHGLGLHAAAMAGEAIHFVIPGREHTVTARKARVDEAHHADHLARRLLLGIAVGRHVALYMTVRALYAECFVEELHDERNVRVWRQYLQVLVGRRRTRAASGRLLRDERGGCEQPHDDDKN